MDQPYPLLTVNKCLSRDHAQLAARTEERWRETVVSLNGRQTKRARSGEPGIGDLRQSAGVKEFSK